MIFNKDKCVYKTKCSLYNTEECNSSCPRYVEVMYLYEKSLLPPKKWQPFELITPEVDKVEYEAFYDIVKDIINFVNNGENLYIYSNTTGNGKSSMAIKMIQNYFNKVWVEGGQEPKAYFIHCQTFLTRMKNAINKEDKELDEILENIATIPLVVFDDIGTNTMSSYDNSTLLSIIDQRILGEKSCVFTSNLSKEQLEEVVGERLASRIYETSSILELNNSDQRGNI